MLVFLAACTVVAWFYPLDNPTLTWLAAVTASNCLAGAHVRARIEFLATRPLVLSRLRVALVVSWALVAVLLPTIGLVSATTVTTIQGDDLRKLPYAAAIITAAALPDASDLIGGSASPPAGNGRAFRGDTPIFITSALRALMLRYLACMALLQCMSFGLLTASSVASARKSGKWRHWVYIAASLMVPVLVLLNSVKRIGSPSLEQSTRLPFPPLWVAALLAIFGLWEMRRSLRLPLRA
jgi:hypothetical protein